MRASSLLIAVGLLACACSFSVVGCSSDETGTGSTASSSSSAGSSSSGASSSSSGDTTSSSSGGSSSSSSGSAGYQTCGDCTDGLKGAPGNECKTQQAMCDGDKGCADIFNCVYAGCSTDHDGGCCAVACYASTGASQASITLFKALDNCVYCTTCKALCTMPPSYDATEYCKVVTAAAPMCP